MRDGPHGSPAHSPRDTEGSGGHDAGTVDPSLRRAAREDELAQSLGSIPDDISELDADVAAWRQEQAHLAARSQRRSRARRLFRRALLSRRWDTFGLSGPLVIAVLLMVAFVGSLASVLAPRGQQRPAPLALGTATASVGDVGGLLPAVDVRVGPRDVAVRDRRPAMLVLAPAACGCDGALDTLYVQAVSYGLHFDLVGRPEHAGRLRAIDRSTANGGSTIVLDTSGRLTALYPDDQLTVVVVGLDGIVAAVISDPPATIHMEPMLSRITGRAPGPP